MERDIRVPEITLTISNEKINMSSHDLGMKYKIVSHNLIE